MRSLEVVTTAVNEEWRAALRVETASASDDFFMLGGTSMVAVSLMERLEQRLGIEFPIEVLFIDGTLGAVTDACISAADEVSN